MEIEEERDAVKTVPRGHDGCSCSVLAPHATGKSKDGRDEGLDDSPKAFTSFSSVGPPSARK